MNSSLVGRKLGLSALWRDLANMGAVGVLCVFLVYLSMWELPALRNDLLESQREARADFLAERTAEREHEAEQMARLCAAIEKLAEEIRRSREPKK